MKVKLIKIGICLISAVFLMGCDSNPEPKNVYEAAVYSKDRNSDDKEQDEGRKPVEILKFTTLNSGMTVADLSAGTGYYTEMLSAIVGEKGKVYLQNKPSYMAREEKSKMIKERLSGRLPNIEVITSDLKDLSLPQKVDLFFVSKIFHDFYVDKDNLVQQGNQEEFFDAVIRNINENGLVLLIDHSAPLESKITLTSDTHRIDENFVKAVFNSHGFELVSSLDVLRNTKDDRLKNIWDGSIFKKTDRFVYLFRKK